MKRRDFLSASVQISGVMLPGLAISQTRPCAPSALAVAGGSAVSSACEPVKDVPTWFADAPIGQWIPVAGGRDQTLGHAYDISANQSEFAAFSIRRGFVRSESGMCVNQDDKELLMVANGGHADGYGNEGYALSFRSESPAWGLLSDRTPHYVETSIKGVVQSVSSTDTQTIIDCTGIDAPNGSFAPRLLREESGSGDAACALKFGREASGSLAPLGLVDSYEVLGNGVSRFRVTHFTRTKSPLGFDPAPGSGFTVVDYFIDEKYTSSVDAGTPLEPTRLPYSPSRPDKSVAVYGDGRPRAMHTVNQQWYANGRVWFPFQNSIASGKGASHIGVVAYNRAWVKSQRTPVPWQRSGSGPQGLGPWEIFGHVPFEMAPSMAALIFCPANYDPHTNKVWMVAGKSSKSTQYWSVDATSGESRLYQSGDPWSGLGSMWSVMIPGADPSGNGGSVMVVAQRFQQNVYVFRPSKAGTDDAHNIVRSTGPALSWGERTVDGAAGAFSDEWGAVYHQASGSILAYNNDRISPLERRLRVLKVPLKNGILDLGGNWVWREVELGGVVPQQIAHDKGVFSKFNLVKDLGGPGTDALVLVTSEDGPTYVCKLPSGNL